MRCLCAWELCMTVERESDAAFVRLTTMLCPWSGAGASLRRLLCLCALLPCLTVEQGSNALSVRLVTMLCPWSRGAMRCLRA